MNEEKRKPANPTPRFALRQLTYLVELADAGSFATAAARLHLSPSAMAVAVSELVLQARFWGVAAGFVVALLDAVLVSPSPDRPAYHVAGIRFPVPDDEGDKAPNFGRGEPYQAPSPRMQAPFLERIMLRNAWANMERMMCRYQPVYCRTW
jgi:hypothetical protein